MLRWVLNRQSPDAVHGYDRDDASMSPDDQYDLRMQEMTYGLHYGGLFWI